MPEEHGQLVSQYAQLEQRVTGIEAAMQNIAGAVTNLANKMDTAQKPQWGLLVSIVGVGLGVISTIGALVYRPIEASIVDLKRHDELVREEYVPRKETERARIYLDRDMARMEKRLDRLEHKRSAPVVGSADD